MKIKLLIILIIFILGLVSVSADELFLQNETTEVLEDTFIDEGNPDLDNGNDGQLIIGENTGNDQQAFIKFSITQLPIGANITKAEFVRKFEEGENIEKRRKKARELLGVDEDCLDLELINKNYKLLAKKCHPDMGGGDIKKFKELNHAHKLLKRELE